MKKASITSTIVAALSVAVISTNMALAFDIQVPNENVVTKSKLSVGKGEFNTFATEDLSTSPTTTGTVTGTVAIAKVSGSALTASVTSTVTGTTGVVDKKSIAKGKVSNTELLALILGTDDKNTLKGYDLVWVSQNDFTSIADGYMGAQNKETGVIFFRQNVGPGDYNSAFNGGGGYWLYTDRKAGKEAGSFSGKGYGNAGWTAIINGVAYNGGGVSTFKDDCTYDVEGNVTSRKKGTVKASGGGLGAAIP